MFSKTLPIRTNDAVESMLHTSFCAVPAFMRVLPMSTSGPTTGQMATSTSSVNSSRGVQVTYTVRAPSERAREMALTT